MKMISLKEDFIEQVTQNYSSKLITDHLGEINSVSGKDILKLTKSKQINFFIIKTLFQEWQDEMKRLESPYFNYKTPEVRKAMVDLMNILSQNIEINRSQMGPLVEKAFYHTLLLYINPAEYVIEELLDKKEGVFSEKMAKQLTKYVIFHKEEMKSFAENFQDMPVKDVIDGASGYFEEYDSIDGLGLFTEQIDDILTTSIEDFVKVEESSEVLKTEEHLSESQEMEAAVSEDEAQEESSDKTSASSDSSLEEQQEQKIDELENDDVQSEIEQGNERSYEEESEPQEEQVEQEVSDEEDELKTLNEKFTEEAKSLADVHEEKKVDSIMEAISINHKYMFLQELFDGDNEVFQKAILEVEQQKSFDTAVEFMVQNYAKDYFWDMNSDEVKEFLKVVFRFFR